MIQIKIPAGCTTGESDNRWRELAVGLVNQLPFGVVLTDRHAGILDMNSRARAMIAAQQGLTISDGRIVATASHIDATLRRAIANSIDPPQSMAPGEPRSRFRIAPDPEAIQILVAAASPRAQVGALLRDAAVLYLFGPASLSIEATALMDLYGLTQAEAHVASRIVAGERPSKISASTGTTLNTVRTHIRRIFTKSGCRTQVEFAYSVLTGPAALGADIS